MTLTFLGLAIGTIAAFGLSRIIAGFLFGLTARDPLVFASTPALLCAVAFLAVWIPARRVTRVDPARALRHD